MFKWFKIIKSQYIGLWLFGLLFFALQEIPYMIMPLLSLTTNPVMQMPNNSIFLNVCEKILGVLCVVAMILIVHKDNKWFSIRTKNEKIFFFTALAIILLNFIGWILYFCGIQTIATIMFFIFALPPMFYVFIGLWRKNYFLIAIACLFFVAHLTNGLFNLL